MNFTKAARPVIMGQNGMVSSGHALASLAGVKILQEGGNAVDAALAAAFVSAVVKPETSGPGGDLFVLVSMKKTGKVEALNSSGPAPAKATIDYFHSRGLKGVPQFGPLSVAVPGAVDGWLELHKKYGTKELIQLTADAVRIARDGFPISQEFADAVDEISPNFPWVDRIFRQPLGSPKPGKRVVQKGLGDVLEKIAIKGRDGFYGGEIADKICATINAEGGILSQEDLRSVVCQWFEPLSSTYRDTVVYEQPPVSQGFMVLEMLNIAEAWPMHDGTMSRADVIHHQVAAKKLAFEDRIRYLEDPAFGDPKIAMLISKEHAAKRRELVNDIMNRAAKAVANQSSDTTYLCATDRDGNAVSFIQSVFAPFGSRVIAGDTGVIMNNRLCSFGLDPRKANALQPGKRPAHTLNTYMVFRGGEVFATGGSPGADEQPQTNFQIIHDLVDLQMDPQSAVEAPRWSHQPGTPPRDQLPEALRMEEGFDAATLDGLRKKGHNVAVVDRWSFGSAKVIARDRENGCWLAGSDPRRVAYALGY
ncbi:MAG TPA: gamma-glutamyltransferase [Candidatus Limnocylindria bacterium]|nr:gamma-glutamyltransferase [Candidatus Limnocylindria bacterium]